MEQEQVEKLALKEKRKLTGLLKKAGADPQRVKALEPVADNVAWMRVKLDEARLAAMDEPLTVEYDNGGGQQGIRENPLFRSYESLFKSYMLGMAKILETLPVEAVKAVEIKEAEPQTVLDIVRARHRQGA